MNQLINNSNSNRELIGIVDEYRKSEKNLIEKESKQQLKTYFYNKEESHIFDSRHLDEYILGTSNLSKEEP